MQKKEEMGGDRDGWSPTGAKGRQARDQRNREGACADGVGAAVDD